MLASVLAREPDLALLPPNLNPRIRDLIQRCLYKSPKRRWQAAGDLRFEIEAALAARVLIEKLRIRFRFDGRFDHLIVASGRNLFLISDEWPEIRCFQATLHGQSKSKSFSRKFEVQPKGFCATQHDIRRTCENER